VVAAILYYARNDSRSFVIGQSVQIARLYPVDQRLGLLNRHFGVLKSGDPDPAASGQLAVVAPPMIENLMIRNPK
jgi:hypothetical protein